MHSNKLPTRFQKALSGFDRRTFLRKLVFSAAMVALGVVLSYPARLIWPNDAFRLDFSILPILVVANLFGPAWSCVTYALTDVLSCLIVNAYAPFLPITLCQAVCGLLLGFAFFRRSYEWKRVLLWLAFIGIAEDFFLMVLTMKLMYFYYGAVGNTTTWLFIIGSRAAVTVLNFVIRSAFIIGVGEAIRKPLLRMMHQQGLGEKRASAVIKEKEEEKEASEK